MVRRPALHPAAAAPSTGSGSCASAPPAQTRHRYANRVTVVSVNRARSRDDDVPAWVPPMLATSDHGRLPVGPLYSYEFKWDGFRCSLRVAANGTTVLTSRNNKDFTGRFPRLAATISAGSAGRALVLDGEIVALNEAGRPDFGLLQNHAAAAPTVAFFAFDVLRLADQTLIGETYDARRAVLEHLELRDSSGVRITPAYSYTDLAAEGLTPHDLLDIAAEQGLEGLMVKSRSATYRPGQRSPAWLKHPLVHTTEVIICGWRPGQGRISGTFGGLLLGAHDPHTNDLVYLGDVGTGWSDKARDDLQRQLDPLEQPESPFTTPIPRADALRVHWVRPELVGEVVYRQLTTRERRLRHTAWRGLRPDRAEGEVKAAFS